MPCIHFLCGIRPLGSVHFSTLTFGRMERSYGATWFDCISYDAPDGSGETIGPSDNEELSGPYKPDWDRGLQRLNDLLAKVHASEGPYKHRDLEHLGALKELLTKCAESPLREYCAINVHE